MTDQGGQQTFFSGVTDSSRTGAGSRGTSRSACVWQEADSQIAVVDSHEVPKEALASTTAGLPIAGTDEADKASSAAVAPAKSCRPPRYALKHPSTDTPAPTISVVIEPVAQQPNPIVVEAPVPVAMAAARADPVITTMPPTTVVSAPNSSMPDNTTTERAVRADRN